MSSEKVMVEFANFEKTENAEQEENQIEEKPVENVEEKSKKGEKRNSTPSLIWSNKVNPDFCKKVIEICKNLWGEERKVEMANGLMAVMNVETRGSFKAQQLEGWKSVKNPKEMTIKDFWKDGKRESSRAIGLIQFTQEALQKNMKEYVSNPKLTKSEKFDELNKLKLSYAQMGEIKQLDKVKKIVLNPPKIYI